MYLLYLDESGTHGGSPGYLLSGIAVHEHDVYHLQQRLETMLQAKLPAGMAAIDFELHGSEIKTPANYRRKNSPWQQFDYGFRLDVLRSAYRAISGYQCVDSAYPCALFGAVVDRYYSDRKRRAYEEVLHRFDEMLARRARATGEHQRGVVIHDESSLEPNVQAWTQRWREVAGRIRGTDAHRRRAVLRGLPGKPHDSGCGSRDVRPLAVLRAAEVGYDLDRSPLVDVRLSGREDARPRARQPELPDRRVRLPAVSGTSGLTVS